MPYEWFIYKCSVVRQTLFFGRIVEAEFIKFLDTFGKLSTESKPLTPSELSMKSARNSTASHLFLRSCSTLIESVYITAITRYKVLTHRTHGTPVHSKSFIEGNRHKRTSKLQSATSQPTKAINQKSNTQ